MASRARHVICQVYFFKVLLECKHVLLPYFNSEFLVCIEGSVSVCELILLGIYPITVINCM